VLTGRLTYSAIAAGLILLGLVFLRPWPLWVSLALAFVIAGVGALLVRTGPEFLLRETAEPEFIHRPEPSPSPVTEQVSDVRLPSSREDYYFLFSAAVRWVPTGHVPDEPRVNMAALAANAIVKRAMVVTRRYPPEHVSLLRHELGGVLGWAQPDETGNVLAMAESVQLALPEEDRERLERLAGVRKEKELWEHARTYEQSKRDYLGKDVLKDPGSAVVWWLARNDEKLEQTVESIPLLASLSAAANNENLPEVLRCFVPDAAHRNGAFPAPSSPVDHLAAFLESLGWPKGSADGYLRACRLAQWLEQEGFPEEAEEIKRRFMPPPESPDEPAPPEPQA